MSRFVTDVLSEFKSDENKDFLKKELINAFNDATVFKYVSNNMDELVENFSLTFEHDMNYSEPLFGTSIYDFVKCLNLQFLKDRASFIKEQIYKRSVPTFVLNDGLATSRRGLSHYQKPANNILDSWKKNSGRGMTAREDVQSDTYETNPFHFSSNEASMQTGVTVCDQSEENNSHLIDTIYNNKYFKALNSEKLWGNFGEGSTEGDERLLSRRIFRNGANGESSICQKEISLHRRNFDRDVREGLAGRERDCIVQKHDMSSLNKRVDQRRAATQKNMTQYC
jgi:hypothetical protein